MIEFKKIKKLFKEVAEEDPEYVNVYLLETEKNVYLIIESQFSLYTGNTYFFKVPDYKYIKDYFLSSDKKVYLRNKREGKGKKEFQMKKTDEKIKNLNLLHSRLKI